MTFKQQTRPETKGRYVICEEDGIIYSTDSIFIRDFFIYPKKEKKR